MLDRHTHLGLLRLQGHDGGRTRLDRGLFLAPREQSLDLLDQALAVHIAHHRQNHLLGSHVLAMRCGQCFARNAGDALPGTEHGESIRMLGIKSGGKLLKGQAGQVVIPAGNLFQNELPLPFDLFV